MRENAVSKNNLIVGVDWLAFTIHGNYTIEEIIEFMGFTLRDFQEMPNGANGYKRMKKHENISILYDGAENMGIHVNITGSSIATLLETYKESLSVSTPFGKAYEMWEETTLAHFCNEILKIGHIARIDLAIDDYGAKYYTPSDILEKLSKGRIVSKWRTYQSNRENVIADNEKVGHTLYFGSKQSDIRLRIYDKKLERNKNLKPDDKNYIHEEWTRWELQLRGERADEIARKLSKEMLLGNVAIGVLSNYFRVIKLDDINKSRCSSESKWQHFTDKVEKLRITVQKDPKTLNEEVKQFEIQQGRKVAKMLYAHGGDANYFLDLAFRFEDKLTPHDREQLGI